MCGRITSYHPVSVACMAIYLISVTWSAVLSAWCRQISVHFTTSGSDPWDLSVFYGQNSSTVRQKSESMFSGLGSWRLLMEEHSFAPFDHSCVGFSSLHPYDARFRINSELSYLSSWLVSTCFTAFVFVCD